jgi:hypothetical protein
MKPAPPVINQRICASSRASAYAASRFACLMSSERGNGSVPPRRPFRAANVTVELA